MNDFTKSLVFTALPFVIISLVSALGSRILSSEAGVTAVGLWFVGLPLLFAALITAIVFAVRRKRQIAAGMFVGIAIGVLAQGVSCFANLSAIGPL